MEWRRTSKQTRSPRVLIQHLTEMGRLDRSESILDFSKKLVSAQKDLRKFNADIKLDVEQQKFFECRWWCMSLATADKTHFAESDVYDIVSANLRDLFVHCRDGDESVRRSAHHLILKYAAFGSQPFVQQLTSEAMLGLMADLLPEPAELSNETSFQALRCSRPLEWIIRALTKPQRQKWVSLLVRLLQGQNQKSYQSTLIDRLTLLWRADDDPRRSYAEADQQLQALEQHSSRDVMLALYKLRKC
ncbi:unnamed protein product [Symbiodinium sp. CCMP2592]|nr:unnamed protein product [Symbiodinium sp. CCMP2592]